MKVCFSFQVCNPSVSVFKGYGLPKEAEEYLVSHGLKNASYTISASDVKDGIFGELVACPYQVCWFHVFKFLLGDLFFSMACGVGVVIVW